MTVLATTLILVLAGSIAPAQVQPGSRWLILGTPAAAQSIPGVTGALALQPQAVLPWNTGRSPAGVLEELALDEPQLRLPIRYQMFELVAGQGVLGPRCSYPEEGGQIQGAERDGGAGSPLAGNDVHLPQAPTVELTLRRDIAVDTLMRHLTFTDHSGDRRRLKMTLTRVPGTLRFRATAFPDGLLALTGLTVTDARSHWDRMSLENILGTTALDIGQVRIVMNYGNDLPDGCVRNITVVDQRLDAVLGASPASVSLDVIALQSRWTWAGTTADMPWCVQLASEDFGKSGSDGQDGFGRNPKYGGAVDNLCSEFVSWYYHQAGYTVGGQGFRDIVTTEQLDDLFQAAGQLYAYHSGHQRFEHVGTGAVYQPRAGDFLERRADGAAEHSMMVLSWDDAHKVATVINGPWPVTLRTGAVQDLEINGGKDFRVGRLRVP